MRTLKYDKEVCKPRDFTISHYLVKRVFATGMQINKSIENGARGNLCKSKFNRLLGSSAFHIL